MITVEHIVDLWNSCKGDLDRPKDGLTEREREVHRALSAAHISERITQRALLPIAMGLMQIEDVASACLLMGFMMGMAHVEQCKLEDMLK